MSRVRDVVVDVLRNQGMTTLFGNPGSTELPFLTDLPSDFSYVLGLNEAVATAMADGYAQASRGPALVNLHTAAGLGNAMGSLVNAAAAGSPVVALVGQQVRALLASDAVLVNHAPHTLPLGAVKFAEQPARAQDVPTVLAQAIGMATAPPAGPVCVSVPMDDWAHHSDPVSAPAEGIRMENGSAPGPDAYAQLLERVGAAKAPVLVVGDELDTDVGFAAASGLADRLGAPVWLSRFAARCGFPTGHGAFQGVLPPDAASVAAVFASHDLVIALGCPVFSYYPYVPTAALPVGCTLVLVTADPGRAVRAVAGQAYLGAPDATAAALLADLPALSRPFPSALHAPILGVAPDGMLGADTIFDVLAATLPEGAIVVNEAIRQLPQFWSRVRIDHPGSFYAAGALGLGFGLPGAVGVALAQRDRPVVAVLGDGALQYTVQALWTAAHYRVPLTVLVLNNGEYAILKDWRHTLELSDVPGLDLPGIDPVAIARGYGIEAQRVGDPETLHQSLKRAFVEPAPRLIDIPMASVDDRRRARARTPDRTARDDVRPTV